MGVTDGIYLILGSGSASRRDILKEMGLVDLEIVKADIDEKATRHHDAATLVRQLGHLKADAVLKKIAEEGRDKRDGLVLLLTGDQVVVHNDQILEKPESPVEARRFIEGYGRAPARTVGSVVITNVKTGKRYEAVDTAEIYFREIPSNIIDQLIEEGDVFYCAGGLKVEDVLVSRYIDHIVGGIDSVMGLSKATVEDLIAKAKADAS
eukprot:Plantae.Rhodophyta-Purpureofilum_apyrenoidigerum.ctg30895.p1 GENE.Plantae.Rhodophyta-Purpureofilum_apyrenoidigerum.ctg30895~~Plantae.Rhodophyta-Purpureofilum_apyrenoidigerum.ctg30895.p1  ORF type:complete len:230 (+),score=41.44 Plantae.Rhodophyta-Purpureofilum_apyrenoidigerum.ctg30895:68-691(+)